MKYLTFFGSEVIMCIFNRGQLEIMIDAFWNLDGVFCPRDGAEIEPHLYPQREGYLLVLACPCCGTKAQVTRYSDPKRFAFRMWTQPERVWLALGHDREKGVQCPVCRARVKRRTIGELIHVFECVRCGNQHAIPTLIHQATSPPPMHKDRTLLAGVAGGHSP